MAITWFAAPRVGWPACRTGDSGSSGPWTRRPSSSPMQMMRPRAPTLFSRDPTSSTVCRRATTRVSTGASPGRTRERQRRSTPSWPSAENGRVFERLPGRPRLITLGPEGAWDDGMVFASQWLEVGDLGKGCNPLIYNWIGPPPGACPKPRPKFRSRMGQLCWGSTKLKLHLRA